MLVSAEREPLVYQEHIMMQATTLGDKQLDKLQHLSHPCVSKSRFSDQLPE